MKDEKMMNRASAMEPKSGHDRPASAAGVGNERKANVRGAQESGANDGLRGAVNHLRSMHPIKHDDLGPHHGGLKSK